MLGAIIGDIIGSVYEQNPVKTKDFPLFNPRSRFTDDTVLTVAVADAIMTGQPYREALMVWGRRYPDAGYGGSFLRWLATRDPHPYNSWGNGAAMRVSPVGYAFTTETEVIREAKKSALISHNHPEGIRGAQATALTVFLARHKQSKAKIRSRIAHQFGYDLDRTIEDIRPGYHFDISCQGTVPEAIIAFIEATSYEDAIRNAVSLGGDSDTLACIAGGIAEAYYAYIPPCLIDDARAVLPPDLLRIIDSFYRQYVD
jgi:ADP-ribosylglycohydrolase